MVFTLKGHVAFDWAVWALQKMCEYGRFEINMI